MNRVTEMMPWQEHRFWLEIAQDHAIFVFDALSPRESAWVQAVQAYIDAFGTLLGQLKLIPPETPAGSETFVRFARLVQPVAQGYYQLEGRLQSLRIDNRIMLDLSPTFLNGTLSEILEYLRLLSYYTEGREPIPQTLVELVDLWLEDQLGHAVLLMNTVDPAETLLLKKANDFQQTFAALMVKQRQIKGYLRFMQPNFAVQRYFSIEIATAVNGFTELVESVIARYKRDQVLNRATLRFFEHHLPETCYFLRKLLRYAPDLPVPDCLLTKPDFPDNR